MDRFNRLLRTHGALAVYFAGILSSQLAAMDQATGPTRTSSVGPVWINDKDIYGKIVNVGFRYTTLKTMEQYLVFVPNNIM